MEFDQYQANDLCNNKKWTERICVQHELGFIKSYQHKYLPNILRNYKTLHAVQKVKYLSETRVLQISRKKTWNRTWRVCPMGRNVQGSSCQSAWHICMQTKHNTPCCAYLIMCFVLNQYFEDILSFGLGVWQKDGNWMLN